MNNKELARELVKGSYDLHVHSAPSHVKRALDDFEVLKEADRYGMAGILLKSHYDATHGRAAIANLYAGAKTKAYGAVTLNWPVGGLNPYAVESCLKLGAKMVWMPTRDAENCLKHGNKPADFFDRPGISIYDDSGKIKNAVYEIIDIVKKYGVCLSTGHLSPAESIELCRITLERKARAVFTHPDWIETDLPLEQQIELARMGVLHEKCWINTCDGSITAERLAQTIRAVGSEHIYITTDRGQAGQQHPADAMHTCVETLLDLGITENEIRNMICRVPASVVQ